MLATVSKDGCIKIWDSTVMPPVAILSLQGHDEEFPCHHLAWRSDSKHILTCGSYEGKSSILHFIIPTDVIKEKVLSDNYNNNSNDNDNNNDLNVNPDMMMTDNNDRNQLQSNHTISNGNITNNSNLENNSDRSVNNDESVSEDSELGLRTLEYDQSYDLHEYDMVYADWVPIQIHNNNEAVASSSSTSLNSSASRATKENDNSYFVSGGSDRQLLLCTLSGDVLAKWKGARIGHIVCLGPEYVLVNTDPPRVGVVHAEVLCEGCNGSKTRCVVEDDDKDPSDSLLSVRNPSIQRQQQREKQRISSLSTEGSNRVVPAAIRRGNPKTRYLGGSNTLNESEVRHELEGYRVAFICGEHWIRLMRIERTSDDGTNPPRDKSDVDKESKSCAEENEMHVEEEEDNLKTTYQFAFIEIISIALNAPITCLSSSVSMDALQSIASAKQNNIYKIHTNSGFTYDTSYFLHGSVTLVVTLLGGEMCLFDIDVRILHFLYYCSSYLLLLFIFVITHTYSFLSFILTE